MWRLRQRAVIDDGYPTHIRHLFRELPDSLRKVDALYERPNGHIVFFSGSNMTLLSLSNVYLFKHFLDRSYSTGPSYWVFDGDRMIEENSNLSWLGLPDGLDHLDAALVWGKNKKTYFFR